MSSTHHGSSAESYNIVAMHADQGGLMGAAHVLRVHKMPLSWDKASPQEARVFHCGLETELIYRKVRYNTGMITSCSTFLFSTRLDHWQTLKISEHAQLRRPLPYSAVMTYASSFKLCFSAIIKDLRHVSWTIRGDDIGTWWDQHGEEYVTSMISRG